MRNDNNIKNNHNDANINQIILSNRLFSRDEVSLVYWFNPQADLLVFDEFHALGNLICAALVNDILIEDFFPLLIYKKLMHPEPRMPTYTLEDLEQIDPTLAHSLHALLETEEPELFCLDFVSPCGKELCKNGSNTPVTLGNRDQFVDELLRFRLETSVEHCFLPFRRSFEILKECSAVLRGCATPAVLRDCLVGSTTLDVGRLRREADYDDYKATDKYIREFWEVLESFGELQLRQFMIFVTASEKMKVQSVENSSSMRTFLLQSSFLFLCRPRPLEFAVRSCPVVSPGRFSLAGKMALANLTPFRINSNYLGLPSCCIQLPARPRSRSTDRSRLPRLKSFVGTSSPLLKFRPENRLNYLRLFFRHYEKRS